jgi:hypothetical protein
MRYIAEDWSELKKSDPHNRHTPRTQRAGLPLPVQKEARPNDLLHFGQMGDRAFGMLCAHIGMTSLAMLNAFLEMLDPFIQMRILPSRPGMVECLLTMLHERIGMSLFAMRHGFLGMFQSLSRMLVSRKGEPVEQRETDKCGNRRNDQCSAMDSHLHGFLLSG